MLVLKEFLGEGVGPFYFVVLLASLAILKIKPLYAAPLFIWGCSMPLTFFLTLSGSMVVAVTTGLCRCCVSSFWR